MKLLYICGSLEPGRDGVGDYTRRLAGELIRQGHSAAILAYNDRHIKAIEQVEQSGDGTPIDVLRLPATLCAKEKLLLAGKFVNEFNPDWLSLQYVPFSFQDKGLPLRLGKQLKKLGAGRKWHIMFHELWVEERDIRRRIIAKGQQFIVKKIRCELNPKIVHTHVPIYQDRLKSCGMEAKPLALFSNIKPMPPNKKSTNHFTIGFFSQVAYHEEIIDFILSLWEKRVNLKISTKIILIGGSQERMAKFAKYLSNHLGTDIEIEITGKLESEAISKKISECTIGISPVPQHLLGKSGSVAAFLTQGIPVAAPYRKTGFEKSSLGFYEDTIRKTILTKTNANLHPDLSEVQSQLSLNNIASIFIRDVQ